MEKKYLGIDWGEKRIGLALADNETKLALPFKTVSTLKELLELIKNERIDEIILGAPRKMSGEEANNPSWLEFVRNLKENTNKTIHLTDERLTSLAANARGFRDDKSKAKQDEIAASIILQDFLDKMG